MDPNRTNRRFTWREVLVVTVIIAVLLAIFLPVLNSHREAQRRATCMNNSHQIGLGMANYASTFNNSFPPSAMVRTGADRKTRTVGGYSFLLKLSSFMDIDYGYGPTLAWTRPEGIDAEDLANQTITTPEMVAFRKTFDFKAIDSMMRSQPREFVCPSSPRGSAWRNTGGEGITNYKAMGATTRGSLVMVVDPLATPPYGTMSPAPGAVPLHPDGAIFPASSNIPAAEFLDGLSHTIFTIETIDEAASRWIVGREATLVGLPQKSSPMGTTPQAPYAYFTPPGFDGKYGADSGVTKAGLRTFLSYDFSPTGADAGTYEDPGFARTPPAYGPSSMHPGVVICGFGDASVQPLFKQIDAANLFFLITKNGRDGLFIP